MRVHPVVVDDLREGETVVHGDEGHHLARVLRVRPGDEVRAFDGRGLEARGVVQAVERDRVTLSIARPEMSSAEPAVEVRAAVPLLKGNKLADVVRMGTELGVRRFTLVVTARAEPDDLSHAKLGRLERVAREAAKQSGRAWIPAIEGPFALADVGLGTSLAVAQPGAEARATDIAAAARGHPGVWTTVTGPEGGLEPAEVEALAARGATPVSLGRSVLRAETAAVVLAAAFVLVAG